MELSIVERHLPQWGCVYLPTGEGPFPTLLLLHGSEGGWAGWSDRDAVRFAAHGFAAMPLRYSGGNCWNAGDIRDVPLDRTVDALDFLRAAPFGNGRVGVFGVSRGGEHALLVASLMAEDGSRTPDAVAAHSPCDVICGAFSAAICRDSGDPGWRPWDPAERAWTWHGSSDDLLPTTPIVAERFEGPLFLSHGTADQVWSVECTRRLEARLVGAGRMPEVYYYEGEGHGLGEEAANLNTARLVDFFSRHLDGAGGNHLTV